MSVAVRVSAVGGEWVPAAAIRQQLFGLAASGGPDNFAACLVGFGQVGGDRHGAWDRSF